MDSKNATPLAEDSVSNVSYDDQDSHPELDAYIELLRQRGPEQTGAADSVDVPPNRVANALFVAWSITSIVALAVFAGMAFYLHRQDNDMASSLWTILAVAAWLTIPRENNRAWLRRHFAAPSPMDEISAEQRAELHDRIFRYSVQLEQIAYGWQRTAGRQLVRAEYDLLMASKRLLLKRDYRCVRMHNEAARTNHRA